MLPTRKMSTFKTRTAIYRCLQAIRARNPQKSQKSLKKVSKSLPARSVRKVSKGVKKSRKSLGKVLEKSIFSVFCLFSKTFWTLRAGRPGETFLRLFGDFGLGDPVAYMIYLEGSEYPEYVMHFYLKYSGTPKHRNMLGNFLPLGPAQQTTEITYNIRVVHNKRICYAQCFA